jgi:hypothetical protein
MDPAPRPSPKPAPPPPQKAGEASDAPSGPPDSLAGRRTGAEKAKGHKHGLVRRATRPIRRPSFIVTVGSVILILAVASLFYTQQLLAEQRRLLAEDEATFAAFMDGQDAPFLEVPLLTSAELGRMRTYLNAQHIETARSLGVPRVEDRDAAAERVETGDLVRIEDNPYYAVLPMDFGVPYLTADAAALLDSIGVRFHERLADAGLPPFQFVVSSGFRTIDDQRRLTGRNVNAARGGSSHEYATTFDITYRRYRPSPIAVNALPAFNVEEARDEYAERMLETYAGYTDEYQARLKALLGRAILDVQDAGYGYVIHERRQPVYHITVAERLASGE